MFWHRKSKRVATEEMFNKCSVKPDLPPKVIVVPENAQEVWGYRLEERVLPSETYYIRGYTEDKEQAIKWLIGTSDIGYFNATERRASLARLYVMKNGALAVVNPVTCVKRISQL